MDIKEKVLNNRKNGMAMMLLFIIFYAAAAGIMLVSAITELIPLMLLAIIWISIGWIPFLGLKVLKPQEALVLTLFGKYVGTLKDAGFYWVNPFCSSVNPAAKTKLNQSGMWMAETVRNPCWLRQQVQMLLQMPNSLVRLFVYSDISGHPAC